MISYKNEIDINFGLYNFIKITAIINNISKPKMTLIETRLKLYNILALPTLTVWLRKLDNYSKGQIKNNSCGNEI